MRRTLTGWVTALITVVPAASLLAHHSLANYDTTTAVRIKGTVVAVHHVNPHSMLFLDERSADGTMRRWAVEGPSVLNLTRRGVAKDFLKPGDIVEACGYLPKERTVWQMGSTDPAVQSIAGRLINGEMLVMPDGRQQSWGDYGVHKCFAPEYTDQHQTPSTSSR